MDESYTHRPSRSSDSCFDPRGTIKHWVEQGYSEKEAKGFVESRAHSIEAAGANDRARAARNKSKKPDKLPDNEKRAKRIPQHRYTPPAAPRKYKKTPQVPARPAPGRCNAPEHPDADFARIRLYRIKTELYLHGSDLPDEDLRQMAQRALDKIPDPYDQILYGGIPQKTVARQAVRMAVRLEKLWSALKTEGVWRRSENTLTQRRARDAAETRKATRRAAVTTLPPLHREAFDLLRKHNDADQIQLARDQMVTVQARTPLPIDASYDALATKAKTCAWHVQHMSQVGRPFDQIIDYVVRQTGWKPPRRCSESALIRHITNARFWRKYLIRRQSECSLQAARILQMTGVGRVYRDCNMQRVQYLPHDIVNRAYGRMDALQDFLAATPVSCESQELSLAEVTAGARDRRIAELKVRSIARVMFNKELGRRVLLLTITPPSRHHPTTTVGPRGKQFSVPNKNYNPNEWVADAIKWKDDLWNRFVSRWEKTHAAHWDYFGALEGTKDTSPHWHLVVYLDDDDGLEQEFLRLLDEMFLYEASWGRYQVHPYNLEPGAREHRLNITRPNKEYADIQYVLEMIRYPLETIDGSDRPCAESLYAHENHHRQFFCRQDNVGIWRWLWQVSDPSGLPDELRDVWAGTRGFDTYEEALSRVQGGDFRRETIRPEHYLRFLKSPAQYYQLAWTEDDLYSIRRKTFDDYLVEVGGDPEMNSRLAWRSDGAYSDEERQAWAHALEADQAMQAESGTPEGCLHYDRKLDRFEKPKRGPNKTAWAWRDGCSFGPGQVAHNPGVKRWERGETDFGLVQERKQARAAAAAAKRAQAAAKKRQAHPAVVATREAKKASGAKKLELSLYCQGPLRGLETPAVAGSADFSEPGSTNTEQGAAAQSGCSCLSPAGGAPPPA